MLVLGLSGGLFRTHEDGSAYISRFALHDASAVLLKDGEVVAAVEEERLNRIKHTNKVPLEAISACLDSYGAKIKDIDYVAYYSEEWGLNRMLAYLNIRRTLENQPFIDCWDVRSLLRTLISREFDYEVPAEKLVFVNHHLAHALSTFIPSGLNESLVVTIDGQGDNESGRVMVANRSSLKTLKTFTVANSLGEFYGQLIAALGFQQFDEYKVMGLAPYGAPGRFREIFKTCYSLLPNGEYVLNRGEWARLFGMMKPRKKHEEITRDHIDFAAALQEALEEIVFHVLAHFREITGQRNLCIAGGVAHNCTLNGKIADARMFDRVFVQPASHDAGCAYGAALSVFVDKKQHLSIKPIRHLYWGTDIGDNNAIVKTVNSWRSLLTVQKVDDICRRTAELIAAGKVVGWVQGRSEFGPRALGNRSILADPRPAENKQIINAMVKKREAFRPFAPSVLEEFATEFFEVEPDNHDLSYMIFVIKVRPNKRDLLGAVTHVDGTARIQTVSKRTNEKYWSLINCFREITGVPVLLNTSFNNNAEPIVDSVQDAIVCFLTTNLHYLIVGDYLVSAKEPDINAYLSLVPSLPKYVMISHVKRPGPNGASTTLFEAKNNYESSFRINMSAAAFDILIRADGRHSLADLVSNGSSCNDQDAQELWKELFELWSRRIILLTPGSPEEE